MPKGPPRIAATRRQLVWNGVQRPLLGLALERGSSLELASARESWERRWRGQLRCARELELGAVLLPPVHGQNESVLAALVDEARALGLVVVLGSSIEDMLRPGHAGALARLAARHGGAFVHVRLPAEDPGAVLRREFFEVFGEQLGGARVPVAVSTQDPFGPGLGVLEDIGGELMFASGLELGTEEVLAPQTLLAQLLAVRPEQHPSFVLVRGSNARELRRIASAGLATGVAFVGVEAAWDGEELAGDVAGVLRELQAVLTGLPAQLGEARDSALSVWVQRERLTRGEHVEPVLGALSLLQRNGVQADLTLAPRSERRGGYPGLWVPAHGVLDAETWTAIWSRAYRGSAVLVSGFAFDAEARSRITSLFQDPGVDVRELEEAPEWLQLRHGSGSFVLTRLRPELEPGADWGGELVARFARWAEIARVGGGAGPFVRWVRFGGADGLRVDLGTGAIERVGG